MWARAGIKQNINRGANIPLLN